MPEFSEEQQIAITEVLGITRDYLNSRVVFLGSRLTQAVIDRIASHLENWDNGIGGKFTKVHPNIKNFGVEIDPEKAKEAIREAIGNLLEIEAWGSSANQYTYLERG